jgi:ribonuclease D
MTATTQYQDITTAEQLQQYCRKLAHAKCIAFDTEFVSENTYRPVLCLIQVDADGDLAVIDPITIGDVTPFWKVLIAPGHETIVHAGRSEVEFCLAAVDRQPSQLIDVQVAAALAGAEYPAGLGTLVAKFLDQTPSKHETRTDWHRRPLSKRQVEYALNDARYLPLLREKIHAKLESLNRLSWLAEEMDAWQQEIERSVSHERWHRVSGNSSIDGRSLAIVRELFHWRDAEAQRRNQPARRILRDDLIVELAKRGSADITRIRAVRGMERGDLQRRLNDIAAAVQRGLDLPEEECPKRPRREQTPELSVLGQFLFAALGSICREAQIAPNFVGTPNDIREWTAHRMSRSRNKADTTSKLAHGWRAEFIGRLFEDLLSGKFAVRIADAKSDHPLVFE